MSKLGKLKDSTKALGGQVVPSTSNLSLNRIRRIVTDGGGTLSEYPPAGMVVSTGVAWGTSVVNNSNNWNLAYGWGNHSLVGYLTAETDPVFSSSIAATITSGNITNWNAAYLWGDHSGLYQALDGDLTAIAALSGTSGLLRKTGVNTWTLDASAYTFQYSLSEAASVVNLVNDSAAPGNSKLYGTNSSGVRGWYDIPTAGTPDAHAVSHQNGGADEISVLGLSGLLADAQTPVAHAVNASTYGYGDGTVAGHLRVGTGLNIVTGTASVAYGSSAGTACIGNDARLSNARTPVAHQLDSATYHTVSGLTTGHFLRAASSTVFAFSALLKGDVLPLLSDWFELVGTSPNQYIRCKFPFAGDYDIQAFSDTGWLPPTIWESMPLATTSSIGGIQLGSGSTLFLREDGTWRPTSTSPMVYPGAGIPLSNGGSWGTSITNNSANWNTAFSWGNHAGLYQSVNTNLTSIAGLSYSATSFVKMTGAGTFTLDTSTYLTGSGTATLSNKTINATTNSITDSSIATGDILKSNGTKFVRLARGSANRVLKVNTGGTDLEYGVVESLTTSGFSILEESGKIVIKYGSTVIFSITSAGLLTVGNDVVAFGTP